MQVLSLYAYKKHEAQGRMATTPRSVYTAGDFKGLREKY